MSKYDYVQKYDVKIRERNEVRLKIEEHLEELFSALELQCYLSDFETFHSNMVYARNVLSFLVAVQIVSQRDAERLFKKLIEIEKERIYLL